MDHGAVAERLGAERILADRLQHAAERRIDHAQQQQEQQRAADEHDVIGQRAAGDGDAEHVARNEHGAGLQQFRHAEAAPVLAAGEPGELRGQHREGGGDRQRDHREEDRLHPQREQPDRQRQQCGERQRDESPSPIASQRGPSE